MPLPRKQCEQDGLPMWLERRHHRRLDRCRHFVSAPAIRCTPAHTSLPLGIPTCAPRLIRALLLFSCRRCCLFCRLPPLHRCTACDDVEQIISVLVPLVVGKVFRDFVPGTKDWVKRWKVRLSLTSSCMLIMVVWQTLSRAQDNLTSVKFVQILSVIAAGIALHFV